MSKRIAVVGSGISGLTSAYLLSEHHDVSLFEANDYLGGHTNTITLDLNHQTYAIDTGFIVFNQKTYPHFCQLLKKLNIPIQLSEMSFSYRSDQRDLEYNGHNLNTLFADRRNLYHPQFYRLLKDIIVFNQDAKKFLEQTSSSNISIQDYLNNRRYSTEFIECYLIPMMSAIWSKPKAHAFKCSAHFIFKFYANHGLLDITHRPPWYVIAHGSKSYIAPMIESFKHRIHLKSPIQSIQREAHQVILQTKADQMIFDEVVIATHSNQALALLADPSPEEINILSAINYTENNVILHTDPAVMPKRKRAWASWNYFDKHHGTPTLTYYMNRLQSIESNIDFFVSMNLTDAIDPNKIIRQIDYAHPCLDLTAMQAQQQRHLINGVKQTYYVGSYWGYGFHEDGVKSAIESCRIIGEQRV